MNNVPILDIKLAMAAILFLIGATSFLVGVIVMILRSTSKEMRNLANQTSVLAQKGMAEEIAGLVGNASALLSATNDLMRTTAGVGFFLTVLGVVVMALASYFVLQIN